MQSPNKDQNKISQMKRAVIMISKEIEPQKANENKRPQTSKALPNKLENSKP